MLRSRILAIDQGTTSSRAIIFDEAFHAIATGQQEFEQLFPRSGWVEHRPDDIWSTTLATVHTALDKAGMQASGLAGIGITNQRETTIVWDRDTGKPVCNAIVWQDRRTAAFCTQLKAQGLEPLFAERCGLLLDPYFSGTKLAWILQNVPGTRQKAQAGKLLFGTVDCFLLWKLTGGRVHATDASNASRTLLFNIRTQQWDDDLLAALDIPHGLLPTVLDCAAEFGTTDPALFGAAIPVRGMAGDQQAATVGQACFSPGMIKSTYGTGCFAVLNTGDAFVPSRNRLLTTVAYRLRGKTTYALEGSIFVAGAAVQWLRDGLSLFDDAGESGRMAALADPEQAVTLVPAFTGLGAPHWDAQARGALFGITRATGPNELARAALESVCFQTCDLLDAMRADWPGAADTVLRVDGGMVASDWTLQRLADLLDAPVDRPQILETTALGAAWLAGMQAGVWPDEEGFSQAWRLQQRFSPAMPPAERERLLDTWRGAVQRTLGPGFESRR